MKCGNVGTTLHYGKVRTLIDPLVQVLHDHMRVAIETDAQHDNIIRCWCNERIIGGQAHREHIVFYLRAALEKETSTDV